jgi:predicted permease
LLGRSLTEDDERESAPSVVVLGYQAWQDLFAGDSRAIGQVVQLAGSAATVVGVMPEGYRFPSSHDAWIPLRFNPLEATPGAGRSLAVVARLADGVSLEEARAEIEAVGRRTAADFPETHGQLRAQIDRFGALMGSGDLMVVMAFYGVRTLFILLLLVACANVATLVFARTVTREAEIALRMSLGATRKRIVLQLFAEALVLVTGATLLGLLIARSALGRIANLFWTVQQEAAAPFWWDDSLSLPTVLYAGVLALVGAVMVGVVPALKATRGVSQPRLSELSTGGGWGLRFGGMWTAVIVFQVGLAVAFLPIAVEQGGTAFQRPLERSSFPASEYVTAQLGRDVMVPARNEEERAEFLEVSRQLFEEVKRRIQADPSVLEVAFASGLSAMNHVAAPVEFVGDGSAPPISARVRTLLVEPAYLDMMGASLVAGRALQPADFAEGSRAVVVNEAFVERVLAGGNPVGGQLRYPEREGEASNVIVPAPGQSYEIVGVVKNPGADAFGPGVHSVVYAPLSLAPVTPRALGLVGMPQAPATQIFAHQRPGSEPLAARLHEIVIAVDPSLRVSEAGTLADAWLPVHRGERLIGWIFMVVAGMVLMLSVAGIYALMSFTVSQRTREIAIRTAVGGEPERIVAGILRRALLQLSLGALVGLVIAFPVLRDSLAGGIRNLVIVVVLLVGAGLVSCAVPIRRALRIQPSHAMKTG